MFDIAPVGLVAKGSKGGTRKLDSRFSVLVQTGRHLVGGAELDKTDLSGWRWRG